MTDITQASCRGRSSGVVLESVRGIGRAFGGQELSSSAFLEFRSAVVMLCEGTYMGSVGYISSLLIAWTGLWSIMRCEQELLIGSLYLMINGSCNGLKFQSYIARVLSHFLMINLQLKKAGSR